MASIARLFLAILVGATISWPSLGWSAPTAPLTEYRSQNGVLDVTLVAAPGKVHVGDIELDGATYNGQYGGPVLRVKPGDLMRVHLTNHLAAATNIHFHGIRTSPLGNGDNAHIAVGAGRNFDYELRVPLTQPPGLYWYHSHLHGISEGQVMAGLTGALVVESPEPPTANAPPERLVVLKDMVFDDDIGNPVVDDELHGIVQSINGGLDMEEQMASGQSQLWRVTNQSADRVIHLTLEGHKFRIVAQDGEARVGTGVVDVLDIVPGGRFDVLVDAGAPGHYALMATGMLTGLGAARRSDRTLGHLEVTGPATDAIAAWTPPATAPLRDLRDVALNAARTIVFTQSTSLTVENQKFFINGKTFDENRVDVRVPLGNIEEWTLRNDSDDIHVFHIHQLGFQLVEVNGDKVPFTGEQDTVQVASHGSVKIRFAFTDPVILGRFIFHCHVLLHEDHGMMAQIDVYDPAGTPWRQQVSLLYRHVWWWMHGIPWNLCGLASA